MRFAETLIAKIEAEHWLLLMCDFEGDWTFEIWGHHPFIGRIGMVGEQTAKQQALSAARLHLQEYGLASVSSYASDLPWRVAVLRQVA
jgi:hypothetical protein